MTGEAEWLTHDAGHLDLPPGQRKDTLWARIAQKAPSWARKGEHLGALSALKRLWPTLFAEEVAHALGSTGTAARFVVSTHTMAMAWQLDRRLRRSDAIDARLRFDLESYRADSVALPAGLIRRHYRHPLVDLARRLPDLLELADDLEDEGEAKRLRDLVKRFLADGTENPEAARAEAYYGLLLMDGDHMGRILSGDPHYAVSYRESFHPQVRAGFDRRAESNPAIAAYGKQRRALSPNRHLAVSAALNDFALHVVPAIVEREHLGRVIYAGGDDVMAMLPVADLLPAMARLRDAYSGRGDAADDWEAVRRSEKLVCRDGFAYRRGRLMRMMGEGATASCGVVIAHHQAPFGAVRRELRDAEQRAKREGGRDAFSITLVKRSGGVTRFTDKWGEPLDLLVALRDFLGGPGVSRRAAYHCLVWLKDLPRDAGPEMLGDLLAYQFERQGGARGQAVELGKRLAVLAVERPDWQAWLADFINVAEFLAREARRPDVPGQDDGREDAA